MAKFIRYALATVCFAASVGCLVLSWRSQMRWDVVHGGGFDPARILVFQSYGGMCEINSYPKPFSRDGAWRFTSSRWEGLTDSDRPLGAEDQFGLVTVGAPALGGNGQGVYFPLWYPALIFALAGVAAFRFRRQFTIRSALIAVTVVAALLGMVVAL